MVKTYLIVTSVAAPNAVLRALAVGAQARGIEFIVIGDATSPSDFDLAGCRFYNLAEQKKLDFSFAQSCPVRRYSRKNIGYLLALSEGADVIVETDDDNHPRDAFWAERQRMLRARWQGERGWTNVYRYFSTDGLWLRGLPLEHIKAEPPPLSPDLRHVEARIQQGLVDGNPDVDAIYRLSRPLPQDFHDAPPVALARGAWCPFNSQNTTWWREAAPLLYLPSHCSFRTADIWRRFIAQRIAWENDWPIVFHAPTVWQERNHHDLTADFRDELPGYLHNAAIAETLTQASLQPGRLNMRGNMETCYAALVSAGFIAMEEVGLLTAWLDDLAAVGL